MVATAIAKIIAIAAIPYRYSTGIVALASGEGVECESGEGDGVGLGSGDTEAVKTIE